MKKNLLSGMVAGVAMLMGAPSLSAIEIPEHLYIVGDASPSLWNIDIAQEMVNEGDGIFSYTGALYKQKLQFITDRNWDAVRWIPEVPGWLVTDANTATMVGLVNSDNFFWVSECATYEIKVYFTESGCTADVKWVDELPPMAVLLGAASGQWDCLYPYPTANIYPAEDTPDLFVWEGTLMPNEAHKHFKYVAYPCNAWETFFYVPVDADSSTGVKMVVPGETYEMQRLWGNQDPAHDHFWGVADEYCDNETKYRATLDTDNETFKLEKVDQSAVKAIELDGDAAGVPVYYNLQGIRVENPANGLYIRVNGNKTEKVVM